jgi:hypothetical protein
VASSEALKAEQPDAAQFEALNAEQSNTVTSTVTSDALRSEQLALAALGEANRVNAGKRPSGINGLKDAPSGGRPPIVTKISY